MNKGCLTVVLNDLSIQTLALEISHWNSATNSHLMWALDNSENFFFLLIFWDKTKITVVSLFTPMRLSAQNKHCHGEPFTPGVSKLCQVRSQVHSGDKAAFNGILKRVKCKIVASCLLHWLSTPSHRDILTSTQL